MAHVITSVIKNCPLRTEFGEFGMIETPRTQTGWSVLSTIKPHNNFVQHFCFVTSQRLAVSEGQLVMAFPGPCDYGGPTKVLYGNAESFRIFSFRPSNFCP